MRGWRVPAGTICEPHPPRSAHLPAQQRRAGRRRWRVSNLVATFRRRPVPPARALSPPASSAADAHRWAALKRKAVGGGSRSRYNLKEIRPQARYVSFNILLQGI